VAWALEGAALVWLFRKIPHRGLLLWAAALLSTVLVRLTLNPAVLSYHSRSSVRIWNWYFYTYAIAAFALFAAARLLPEKVRREWPKAQPVTAAAGALLLSVHWRSFLPDRCSDWRPLREFSNAT
jgi:hypothetical protein